MKVKINCGIAEGQITAPSSKSVAHRMLICAAFARGESRILGITPCADVLATIECLNGLGAKISLSGDTAVVEGFDVTKASPKAPLFANESGSTLRFLIPPALLSDKPIIFNGAPRLLERPMTVYEDICRSLGLKFERCKDGICVCGPLKANSFKVRGDVSSQFITGLLFALPLIGGGEIEITTRLESKSYIDLTLDAMREFGVSANWDGENKIKVSKGEYRPRDVRVEGDWSAAAFHLALNCVGGNVSIIGLNDLSKQGDKVCEAHLLALSKGPATISLHDCPDLGPILFAVAAACHGGEFTDTARLKIKESDRAAVMAEELSKFGAEIEVHENSVTIKKSALHAPVDLLFGHNDHRVVMSLSVLCTKFGGEIDGAEAVAKSYPAFFEHLSSVGIKENYYGN